jgi:hypothetical protein
MKDAHAFHCGSLTCFIDLSRYSYHRSAPSIESGVGAEVDVHGAQGFVGGVGEEEIGHGVDELVQDVGGRVFVTLRSQVSVDSEAESGQFALVVQQAVGHVVITGHILGDVVPVMVTHGLEAMSEFPVGLLDFIFGEGDGHAVLDGVNTLLQPQTSASSVGGQLILSTTSRADGAGVNEVGGQGPVVSVIDVHTIGHVRGWVVFGLEHRSLDTGDDTIGVEQEAHSGIFLVPVTLAHELGIGNFALVIAKLEVGHVTSQVAGQGVEGPQVDRVQGPGGFQARPFGDSIDGGSQEYESHDSLHG